MKSSCEIGYMQMRFAILLCFSRAQPVRYMYHVAIT